MSATTNPRRALIVDDNVDAAHSLAELFSLHGVYAICAASGSEALALTPFFKPHIVFLDISMPVMDGYEVLAALQQMPETKLTRFIAFSSKPVDEVKHHPGGDSFSLYIQKPASISTLLAVLT